MNRDETFVYLRSLFGAEGRSEAFSAASGLYWHCADWHEGQSSERYRILSTLGYKPGACESGPEPDSTDEIVYRDLENGTLDPADVEAWIRKIHATEEPCD